MKKNLFFYGMLIALLTTLSCNDDETENLIPPGDNFKITSYHGFYGQYNTQLTLNPTQDNLVNFEYDQFNRIIKRIGNVVYANPNSGIEGYLHNLLYTSLTYSGNKVFLENKISANGNSITVPENETIITIGLNNRMSQKTTFKSELGGIPQRDTTNYTYENDRLISYVKTSNLVGSNWNTRYFEESNLYYTNENLDSIVTISSRKSSDESYLILDKKETQLFEGYDMAQNPFRKLQFFKETFNRSLSKNNFTTYRKKSHGYNYPGNDYNQTPIVAIMNEVAFQTWSFAYDQTGEWMYNQF